MLKEFNVHTEVSRVEATDASPIQKARRLLQIAKRVRTAARRLAILGQRGYREGGDPLRAARFREAAQRLCGVYEDVRSQAGRALRTPRPPEGEERRSRN